MSDVAGDIAVITSVDKMHSPLVVADPQPNQAAAESKEKVLLFCLILVVSLCHTSILEAAYMGGLG